MQAYSKADLQVIPINEAFSQLHGEEIFEASIDLIEFRKRSVAELKNTRSLESTRLLLESKVVKYMKNEYDNKYGRLERLRFEDGADFADDLHAAELDPEKIDLDYLVQKLGKTNAQTEAELSLGKRAFSREGLVLESSKELKQCPVESARAVGRQFCSRIEGMRGIVNSLL